MTEILIRIGMDCRNRRLFESHYMGQMAVVSVKNEWLKPSKTGIGQGYLIFPFMFNVCAEGIESEL